MGENLALNLESRGHTVAVYNRTTAKVDSFVGGRAKGKMCFAISMALFLQSFDIRKEVCWHSLR